MFTCYWNILQHGDYCSGVIAIEYSRLVNYRLRIPQLVTPATRHRQPVTQVISNTSNRQSVTPATRHRQPVTQVISNTSNRQPVTSATRHRLCKRPRAMRAIKDAEFLCPSSEKSKAVRHHTAKLLKRDATRLKHHSSPTCCLSLILAASARRRADADALVVEGLS